MNLLCALYPNSITVTANPQYPLVNQVTLGISFPDEPVPGLVNPQGLTPDNDLPGRNAVGYNLSRIYIWFPWGTDSEKGFASNEESEKIAVSPGPNNSDWYCVAQEDDEVGRFWILFPKHSGQLATSDSLTFVLDQIISTAKSGQSYIFVKNCCITGYTDGVQPFPIMKQAQGLAIHSFRALPSTIAKGAYSTLSWDVAGASSCTLYPGGYAVALTGQKQVILNSTTDFTLTAQNDAGQSCSQDVTVYVNPPTIQSFTADVTGPVDYGTTVTLQWDVWCAAAASIDQGIGTVASSQGSVQVVPQKDTTYTLKCTGAGDPVTQNLTIKVNSIAITSFSANPPAIDTGQAAVLSWTSVYEKGATGKILAANVITGLAEWSAPELISSNVSLPNGQCTVTPSLSKGYRLVCQGPNGEVSNELSLPVNHCVGITQFEADYAAGFFQVHWNTENASTCSVQIQSGNGCTYSYSQPSGVSGNLQAIINDGERAAIAYKATITCSGSGGTLSKQISFCRNISSEPHSSQGHYSN
ncbi:hypothetical protein SPSIL_041270 [Sporomusa silvacetica DSM 10669]|uniref:Ig-like domain-containing protein n=1 Tax=Sporomusa silvacetica DSM 10669 TaxID=1123289 RepID=A0ABZ3IR59_9FIRM|nr:hypothetical protein [Sporomusa silvacetica]OZC20389.1 hypothetical protein SPSIL_12560 [Sporomusa silvacetica DSM 10669]